MRKNFTLLSCLFLSVKLFALDPNHFTITRVSAPYFVVDGNSPTTLTKAYVGFEVTNNSNSATTYSNLRFTITSIGTSVAGQNYSIVSPASGVVNVGTLAPGATKVCYYYIQYPASTTPQGTFNVQLSDLTVTGKTQSFLIRNRSSISANAGGTATQTISNQDLIGATVIDDVTYVVGNVQNGDENDFQVAVSSSFDPSKVSLLSTEVISSSVPGIIVGTTDSLYYLSGNGSNGATVTIRWTFRIVGFNFTTYLLPCAGATSGGSNYKYALNTALVSGTPITVTAGANPLTITKTSDKSLYGVSSTARFTITIANPGAYPVTIDRITDELPAGFSFQGFYAGSYVTATNSTAVPTLNATGTITFEGGVSSGANSSYLIPAGGSIQLIYTATTSSGSASNLLTTARHYVGTTQVGSAQNTVSVSATLPLVLASFDAKKSGNTIQLQWKTSQEFNTDHFELERSGTDGRFAKVREIASAGNSVVMTNYNWNDASPLPGINFYRLKTVDRDGSISYSKTIAVAMNNTESFVRAVYPNPATSTATISFYSTVKQAAVIHIVDAMGRSVQKLRVFAEQGLNEETLELNGLSSGSYTMQLSMGTTTLTKKISIVH